MTPQVSGSMARHAHDGGKGRQPHCGGDGRRAAAAQESTSHAHGKQHCATQGQGWQQVRGNAAKAGGAHRDSPHKALHGSQAGCGSLKAHAVQQQQQQQQRPRLQQGSWKSVLGSGSGGHGQPILESLPLGTQPGRVPTAAAAARMQTSTALPALLHSPPPPSSVAACLPPPQSQRSQRPAYNLTAECKPFDSLPAFTPLPLTTPCAASLQDANIFTSPQHALSAMDPPYPGPVSGTSVPGPLYWKGAVGCGFRGIGAIPSDTSDFLTQPISPWPLQSAHPDMIFTPMASDLFPKAGLVDSLDDSPKSLLEAHYYQVFRERWNLADPYVLTADGDPLSPNKPVVHPSFTNNNAVGLCSQSSILNCPSSPSEGSDDSVSLLLASGTLELAQQQTHSLYKTELCRSWEETGNCRYGAKCQFAHGSEDLRPVARHPKYKTEICRTFNTSGTCPYGTRCRFIHRTPATSRLLDSNAPAAAEATTPSKPSAEDSQARRRLPIFTGICGYDMSEKPEVASGD